MLVRHSPYYPNGTLRLRATGSPGFTAATRSPRKNVNFGQLNQTRSMTLCRYGCAKGGRRQHDVHASRRTTFSFLVNARVPKPTRHGFPLSDQ